MSATLYELSMRECLKLECLFLEFSVGGLVLLILSIYEDEEDNRKETLTGAEKPGTQKFRHVATFFRCVFKTSVLLGFIYVCDR